MTRRGFSNAIDEGARVTIDFGANVYHLYFSIGTESWKASSVEALMNFEKRLFTEDYEVIDRQDCDRMLTFAK